MKNPHGLHARAATAIAGRAQQFECSIRLLREHLAADAKSVLDILTLGAPQGAPIEVRAQGRDASLAVEALGHLFMNSFRMD